MQTLERQTVGYLFSQHLNYFLKVIAIVESGYTLVSEDGHDTLLKYILASITNPAKQLIQVTFNET